MAARWISFLVALAVVSPLSAREATAWDGAEIREVSDFHEPLAPLGHWVEIEPYGWCWYPAYVGSDWRPYADGHWLWSEGGWYWMSDEPWAWACYHYGGWVHSSYYGWVWVPGTEWAPSWVSWREGDDHIGWAPLPPESHFQPRAGVVVVEHVVFAPHAFVFVERRRFCDRIRPSVIIVNKNIIHKTVNVTKIRRERNTVINNGPDVGAIERESGRRVQRASTREFRRERPERTSVQPATSPVFIQPQPQQPKVIERAERGNRQKQRLPEIIRGGRSDIQSKPVAKQTQATPPVVFKQHKQDRARAPVAVPAIVGAKPEKLATKKMEQSAPASPPQAERRSVERPADERGQKVGHSRNGERNDAKTFGRWKNK